MYRGDLKSRNSNSYLEDIVARQMMWEAGYKTSDNFVHEYREMYGDKNDYLVLADL
jgi:hypothetical protein